jgi:cell division protein FtsW
MGLASLFGMQAIVNMAVNTGLLPTKGITLPFISVGGSSTLATGVGLGMLLALTRRSAACTKRPAFLPDPAGPQAT